MVVFSSLLIFHFAAGLDLSSSPTPQKTRESCSIPAEYGEVVYRYNESSPNQIFIIGMSHRDTVTRLNGSLTSRVQAEVYRVGDALIHQQAVELLLPEGFFRSKAPKVEVKTARAEVNKAATCSEFSDAKILLSRLGDNRTYVNAEMLLKEGHSIQMDQVEDETLYFAVRDCILKLVKTATNSCD